MRIDIDGTHYVISEPTQWIVRSGSGYVRTRSGDHKETFNIGYVWQIGTTLAHHLIIPFHEALGCVEAQTQAQALEEEMHEAGARHGRVILANGQYVLRPGLGDWLLSREGKGRFTASCPSIRHALLIALERTLRADDRTIQYRDLDRVAYRTALELWQDWRIAPSAQSLAVPVGHAGTSFDAEADLTLN